MLARVSDPISLRQQIARRLRCETGLSIDFLQVSSNKVHSDPCSFLVFKNCPRHLFRALFRVYRPPVKGI
jgi:hypothetical protein